MTKRWYATIARERGAGDGGELLLRSPTVGLFVPRAREGAIVQPGDVLGELEILGLRTTVLVPEGAFGRIVGSREHERLPVPVDYGAELARLDPHALTSATAAAPSERAQEDARALVFRSPLPGRFYACPSPGAPPFAPVGSTITRGQTIALIEVMKTFHRVVYGGDLLPERARIVAVCVHDEADVEAGAPLLELTAE